MIMVTDIATSHVMTIKAIYPPPAGRPRWSSEATVAAGLDYLSWGWREYGRHPIPLARHDGWTYQAVLAGTVCLQLENAKTTIGTGSVVLISPECAYGWSGRASDRCKILSWIWRDAPAIPGLERTPQGWSAISLPPVALATLRQLHRETRSEATLGGDLAAQALGTIRTRMDILLARALMLETGEGSRFRLAWRWLTDHPGELRPVRALSDYLQMAPSSLQRLFEKHKGMSVREAALAIRMRAARQGLRNPVLSVKEIALHLGYAHSGDFTRAYKSFWGKAPSADRKAG
ncbi:AraC-type DNA-binding protein [Terrimicrobium sacchariphilum]|uniref:AraC-type DNA-binding protein n=2 Tax=Terrimicrobium sacchariphilum TaxID=690879 RepID=A0A146G332_TERSA|nr:AraC-type DNA-binding protein [Terrimicrobium sacchariphilum]